MRILYCFVTAAFVLGSAIRQAVAAPKEPTARSGYRSSFAMMNVAVWNEAQRIWARAMLAAGIAGLAASTVCYFLIEGSAGYLASMLISAAAAACTVPYTESRLKATFDEKGLRKRKEGAGIDG